MTEWKEKGLSQSRFTLQCTAPPCSKLAEKAAKLQYSASIFPPLSKILHHGINLSHPEGWKANIGENDALLQELYRKAADRA
ncbi:hypothetical protein ABU162_00190 [Paenibacillus thiaminolyticus]|uniref:hypothetical protein n=1 Tax=Paenibacillus thiaminolyticus TaxID=49283 RepID=UPI0035A6B0E3